MADTQRLVAFTLALVGGILALADGAQPILMGLRAPNLYTVFLVVGGILAILGAVRGWRGSTKDGALLAIVGGVVTLVAGHTLAGVLALVGGVVFLVK